MLTTNATIVRVNDLHAFCVDTLRKLDVGEADAHTTADVLVTTDTWGVFTHGVKALRGYARRLRGGGLRADARPAVVREGPAWAVVDGGSALGMVTSALAMRTAVAKARVSGVGFVGVRNSCHFGAAGYYAHLAAAEGCIGLAMANDVPSVTAPGARGAVTGTNPLAYAVPMRSGRSILLDMATSTVAGGKVAAAHALGKTIPEHWIIDRDGRPSTDPAVFLQGGALTPMAGHKGYGLALLIETLSGLLTGAAFTRQILRWMGDDPAKPTGHGAAFLAMHVDAFLPLEEFFGRVEALAAEIHNTPLAPGAERVYLPGEMEWERRDRALTEGICFPEDVLASLHGLAEEFDLDLSRIHR